MFASLALCAIGIAAIFGLGKFAENASADKAHYAIRKQAIYQPLILLTAICLYGIHRLFNPDALSLLSLGGLDAHAEHLGAFGIDGSTPWSSAVVMIAFAMFAVTTLVVFLQIVRGKDVDWKYLPIAFALSLIPSVMNSLSEEIVFRFIAIEGLSATHATATIAILCGVWFGLPHYFGSPGKIPGVLMAGFLGWVLAWATIETRAIGVAWFVHFVQDVPIFTMIFWQAHRLATSK